MCFSLQDIDYSKLRDQLIASGQRLDVNVGQYPPCPPDEESLLERERHSSEPETERGCVVTMNG